MAVAGTFPPHRVHSVAPAALRVPKTETPEGCMFGLKIEASAIFQSKHQRLVCNDRASRYLQKSTTLNLRRMKIPI
jgi:hypothetical protein